MARDGLQDGRSIESLKERLARDPFSRAFLGLAEEYRKAGRFKEAIRVCLEGLDRHPLDQAARVSLGRTYLEAGDLENARRTLAEVLEATPDNHLAGKLLGEVQRQLGDLQGAGRTYREILRHYPADREIEALLASLAPPAASTSAPAPPARAPVPTEGPAGAGLRAPGGAPDADPALDYRPEDLAGTQAWGGGAPPPAAALPGSETCREAEPDVLQTNTLAELYLRQGLIDRALGVYRAMMRVDPGNEKARRRLEELAGGSAAAVPPSARAEAPPPPPTVPPPHAAALPPPPSHAAVGRLERWLRSIQGGSGGAPEVHTR